MYDLLFVCTMRYSRISLPSENMDTRERERERETDRQTEKKRENIMKKNHQSYTDDENNY